MAASYRNDQRSDSMTRDDGFALANRAFELFTLAERERALERFASLRYASINDRFFDAVHFVIESRHAHDEVARVDGVSKDSPRAKDSES
jgi:hypothetical protein